MIVIKSGPLARNRRKAAATHTGALAGSDAAVGAAFRRAGLVRVEDLEELFAAAETLTCSEAGRRQRAPDRDQWRRRRRARGRRSDANRAGARHAEATTLIATLDKMLPGQLVARQSRSTSSATQRPKRYAATLEAVLADKRRPTPSS